MTECGRFSDPKTVIGFFVKDWLFNFQYQNSLAAFSLAQKPQRKS
jgi:hypothetical protein